MAIKISLGFIVLIFMLKGISAAAIDTKNGYIFTAPKSLNIGQDNELQLLRFGCLDESTLKVRLYYTKSYGSDELLLQEQNFQIEKGKKDSLLQLNVKSVDDGDYIYSGRLQINGTMCGKPISGSDDVDFSNSKPNIYIIQTDKPMYKPGQEVKFRVLKMDKNLKPSNKANDTADVYVEDPQGNKLFQFKGVQLGKGIAEMKFPLADEPVHGTWRIFLSDKHDSPSTTFDVKEYKLPKFSVSIEFPSFVLKNANTIPVSVCAEYTYGEPVTGTLNLNTSLEIYSYQSSYSRTPILHNSVQINGCYNYTINVDSIDPDRRFNYKRIQVTANVTEKGTGIQKVETKYLDRSYSPLKLDFNTDENHGKYYKPGLPYKGKLKVTNPDNSPAPQEPVEICATVSRKRVIDTWLANKKIKYCRNFTSDANGNIHYTIVPQNTDSVSIDLHAKSLKYTEDGELDHPTDSAYLDPFYSPSGSFIQLETISKPIPCGTQKNIRLLFTARKNTQFKLIYQVLKKGKVMYTGNQDINFKVKDDVSSKYEKDDEIINASETQLVPKLPPASSSSSSESTSGEENCPSTRDARYVPAIGDVFIPLNVNATLSPSFTLLVFYVRDDRETIADSQKILVEKCFNNKVNFQFKDAVKQPGTPTSIQVSSSPNSLCGIKVVDKSISLLDNSDQLTKDKIFDLIEDNDYSDFYSSDLCEQNKPQPGLQSSELSSKVHPSDSWHSSSYEDSYAAFQEAGFLVISNFVLFSRPCADNGGDDYDDYITGEYLTGEYLTGEYETAEYDAVSGGEPIKPHKHKRKISSLKSAVDVRNYFPETWLFQLQMTGPDGIFKAKETLPHTITEWEGSAVCINSQDGLGLSNVTSIRGFQPFFISYNLPISVIRGEEFVVVVTIFSYADAALPISVTLDQPKGFEVISDLKNSNLCIQPSSSESLPITLKATAVGSVNITVRAQTETSDKVCGSSPVYDGLARDAITQSFEVEAEGFANEKSHSILFCPSDEENQKFSKSFDLTLPDDAVPDSQRAFVDVTGNVMGPSIQNLNNLVSLPTGCGEQNMVKFTPNYLVLDYLTDIGKLTDNIKSEAITNLNTGYQRELNYRHFDGSFSAFGENDNEGSMFLTAFVLRSFYEAKRYILIDDVVLKDAQKWITGKQRSDGCFPNIGQIIDSGIKGGLEKDQNNGTITAYVVASLLISKYHNQTVINNAISCLQKNNPLNPYETFMYAYALALQGRKSDASSLIDQMKPFANNTDGVEYYRNPGSTKSTDIETAAYAVLTNLKVGNSKSDILPLIRYLTMNMNPYGGFHSTQDTCVGLDAISRFAKIIYKDPVNIALSIRGGLEEQLKITEDNKILVQRNKVSQVPSELDIEATGSGCGLLQTSLRFNTVTPPEKRKFDLQITGECTNSDCTERSITTLVSYKPDGKKSGMSVVQIKMITGTVADKDSLDKLTDDQDSNILRTEVENNKVNIYFSEISNDVQQFSFDVKEIIKVNNPQPGTAKVFDYYAPEYSTSTTYTFGK